MATEPEKVIEFVEQVTWYWLLLAFAFGIAGGIVVVAIIGREREGTEHA